MPLDLRVKGVVVPTLDFISLLIANVCVFSPSLTFNRT